MKASCQKIMRNFIVVGFQFLPLRPLLNLDCSRKPNEKSCFILKQEFGSKFLFQRLISSVLFSFAKERGNFSNIKSPFDQSKIIELLLRAMARAYFQKCSKTR